MHESKERDAILQMEHLRMHYVTKTEIVKAVEDVGFVVHSGETFGLVGESGCGKSATCRSILRLLPPVGKVLGGSIYYKGRDLLTLTESQMRAVRGKEIGMIFQEPMTALNPVLKIKEQMFEQFIGRDMSNREKTDRAVEMLRLVGIPSPERRLEEYIHQYSGGMRQRAMIAITLASNPSLLLADEPTTALDVTIQDQIIKLINGLKEKMGTSIILVTHDLGVISQMCDRVAVMYAGTIVEMTDTVTLFGKPRHPYTEGLIHSIPGDSARRGKLESISGMPPDLTNLPPGCPFLPRCKYAEGICARELPPLETAEPGHCVRCHFWKKLSGAQGLIDLERDPVYPEEDDIPSDWRFAHAEKQ